jgi:flagellar FliL protein
MKFKRLLVVAVAGSLTAAAGGAAAWWGLKSQQPVDPAVAAAKAAEKERAAAEKHPPRYVSLDKVIVMLHREPGDPATHYLALDLVFKTPEDQEKTIREHLPMLRSVAVRALSALSPAKAGGMSIDEYAAVINRAYADSYAAEKRAKPFADVMIGKLIIE